MSEGCGREFSSRQKPVCHPPMSGPFELTAAFCTPGNTRILSRSAFAKILILSRSLYFFHGNSNRTVKSARGSYPNDSDCSRTPCQCELHVSVRGLPRRPQTEKHCRQRRDQKGETQNRQIKGDLLESRNASRTQRHQTVSHPERHKETERSTQECNDKTFN